MTYEERLQAEYKYWDEAETENDLYVDDAWLIAKRTVSMQAAAIRKANRQWGIPVAWTESYLEQNGYIPEKEEE